MSEPARRPGGDPVTRRRGPDPRDAARVVVVVALVALTAVGVSARRGLDWDRLVDVPDLGSEAARSILLAAVTLALVGAGITAWLLRRRRRRPPPQEEDLAPAVRLRWYVVALTVLAVAVVVVLLAWLGQAILSRQADGDGSVSGSDPTVPSLDLGGRLDAELMVTLLVLLAGVGALALLPRRLAPPPPPPGVDDSPAAPDESAAELAAALTAAADRLQAVDVGDARAAILAAYAAMTASLARHGSGRRPSDTPTDLLDRAVAGGLVSRGAAHQLTELFREARFSSHPMPESAREAAEAALGRVRDELAGVRRG